MVQLADRYPNIWLRPGPSLGPYVHDARYMCSLSIDPMTYQDHSAGQHTSTGCVGDSGGPVFFQDKHGKIFLFGIQHGAPIACGDATPSEIQYDTSVFTGAARTACFPALKLSNLEVNEGQCEVVPYGIDSLTQEKCEVH